jgi:hypothetical protein
VTQFAGGRELCLFPYLHDREYSWCCISLSSTFYTYRCASPLIVRSCQVDFNEEQIIEVVYSLLWAIVVFWPLKQRLYESVTLGACFGQADHCLLRFPRSLPAVIVGSLETMYLWGFLLLELVVTLCPVIARAVAPEPEKWEFLPLMLTSLYCALGLVWAYARLSFLYITSK